MKQTTIIVFMTICAVISASGAPGSHGMGSSHMTGSNPGSLHSNAPEGTPSASSDRDTGTDRAEDVGKGKKKGLIKHGLKNKKTDLSEKSESEKSELNEKSEVNEKPDVR